MDIRNITPGLAHSEAATARRADEAEKAREQAAAASAAEAPKEGSRADEVRLSQMTGNVQSGEFTVARAALEHAPGLSKERRAEIQARIQSGYYTNPEITEQVAERMADALKGGKEG